jgi:hypothetical protein
MSFGVFDFLNGFIGRLVRIFSRFSEAISRLHHVISRFGVFQSCSLVFIHVV